MDDLFFSSFIFMILLLHSIHCMPSLYEIIDANMLHEVKSCTI